MTVHKLTVSLYLENMECFFKWKLTQKVLTKFYIYSSNKNHFLLLLLQTHIIT